MQNERRFRVRSGYYFLPCFLPRFLRLATGPKLSIMESSFFKSQTPLSSVQMKKAPRAGADERSDERKLNRRPA